MSRFSDPWGPRRAPGAPGTAPARKIVRVAPTISSGDQLYDPFVGTLCFWTGRKKDKKTNDKFEAPQGPSSLLGETGPRDLLVRREALVCSFVGRWSFPARFWHTSAATKTKTKQNKRYGKTLRATTSKPPYQKRPGGQERLVARSILEEQ